MAEYSGQGLNDFTSWGSPTTGGVYDFGAANRALGLITTSHNSPEIGLTVVNNTGVTLPQVSISFTGEQWTENTDNQELDFYYSTAATALPLTSSPVDFTQDLNLTWTTTQTVGGSLSGGGTGGLTKIGAGQLILSGANSYSGGTTVVEGTLLATSAGALTSGGSLIIGAGACMVFDPSAGSLSLSTASPLTMAAGSAETVSISQSAQPVAALAENAAVAAAAIMEPPLRAVRPAIAPLPTRPQSRVFAEGVASAATGDHDNVSESAAGRNALKAVAWFWQTAPIGSIAVIQQRAEFWPAAID